MISHRTGLLCSHCVGQSSLFSSQYNGLYLVQLGFKVFAYSAKLQCEIAVLGRLIEFTTRARRLDDLAVDFQLTSALEREWNSTLERTFGVQEPGQDQVWGTTQVAVVSRDVMAEVHASSTNLEDKRPGIHREAHRVAPDS